MALDLVLAALGLVLVAATAGNVFATLLVPRARQSRLTSAIRHGVMGFGRLATHGTRDFEAADRRLAIIGPTVIVAQLVVWTLGLLTGFTLLLTPFVDGFWTALREAASSMLTLGFATTVTPGATAIDLFAALAGFGLFTIQIAYLPTLYDAFNRRERLVTLLEARAGSPPWGPELLWRHRLVDIEDQLPALFAEWEGWAADVAESHTNYPALLNMRSPHVRRFWLLSLLAVLDAAAMQLALNPSTASSQARLCLRMGFTALRDIARTNGIEHDADPRPDAPIQLTFEEFAAGVDHVAQLGGSMERTAEQAWADFRGWRVNYESVAYALAYQLGAPPSPWGGPRWFDFPEMVPFRPRNRRPDDVEGEGMRR